MKEGILTIRNRLGLHARAAAQFVKMANDHKADVWVEKDGTKVNGKSIMGLLMLACPLGSSIMVKTEGVDETEAFEELKNLVEGGFGER